MHLLTDHKNGEEDSTWYGEGHGDGNKDILDNKHTHISKIDDFNVQLCGGSAYPDNDEEDERDPDVWVAPLSNQLIVVRANR